MRLLFITPAYPPFPGGGERYARSLAQSLALRGYQITVVTSTAQTEQDFWQPPDQREPVTESQDGSIRIIRCPLSGITGGRTALFAWRKIMVVIASLPGERPELLSKMARLVPPILGMRDVLRRLADEHDLIHGFNISWEYPLVEAYQLTRMRHLPLVVTPFLHVGSGKYDRVARNSTMDHQRLIIKNAGAVLALTSIEVERLHNWGIRPRFATVIGGGLDPLPSLLDVPATMAKYGLSGQVVLFIGRASFDKGALQAARSILRLNEGGLPVTLAFIGQVSPEFKRFYKKLNDNAQRIIRPLGQLEDREKHTLLEGATALVMPSRSDSFGIVFLEAWAHQKPVIGARSGGIPAVIDDGENGLLVTFGDGRSLDEALVRLLADPEQSARMGRRGYDKVSEHYTWDNVADQVELSYRHILNQSL